MSSGHYGSQGFQAPKKNVELSRLQDMTYNDDNLKMVGKRMPYTMPNDLFGRMQNKVMRRIDEIEKERPLRRRRNTLILKLSVVATAVAASVCLFLVLHFGNSNGNGNDNYGMQQTANSASVEKAYDSLSQEEKENLLADYKNDIYMRLQ